MDKTLAGLLPELGGHPEFASCCRVEMRKLSVTLVETVNRWQVLISVAEAVLPEGTCFVPDCFYNHGERRVSLIQTYGRACHSHVGQTGSNR